MLTGGIMDKKALDTIADVEQRLVVSKIIDTVNLAAKYHEPRFSRFLDPVPLSLSQKLRFDADLNISFFGGYEGAERQILCAAPEWMENETIKFPIVLFRVNGYGAESLSHRDYLGSLMGLGITRDMIGDIVVNDGVGFLFVYEEMANFLELNLERVGRAAVKLERIAGSDFVAPEKKLQITKTTVSSPRLDAVLAGALNLSRSKASELIKSGSVRLNFSECVSLSAILSQGDLISVRGFGRFRLGQIGSMSKKGRIFIEIERFL